MEKELSVLEEWNDLDFDFEVIEMDDVTILPETAASSGSSGDNTFSTCGSCSCCSSSSCCT